MDQTQQQLCEINRAQKKRKFKLLTDVCTEVMTTFNHYLYYTTSFETLVEVASSTKHATIPKKKKTVTEPKKKRASRSVVHKSDFMMESCRVLEKSKPVLERYFDNHTNNWFLNQVMEMYISDQNTGQLQIYVNNSFLFIVIKDCSYLSNYLNDTHNTTLNNDEVRSRFNTSKFGAYYGKLIVEGNTLVTRTTNSKKTPNVTTRFRPLN